MEGAVGVRRGAARDQPSQVRPGSEPGATLELKAALCESVVATQPAALIDEQQFRSLIHVLSYHIPDGAQAIAPGVDSNDAVFAAVAAACVNHIRSSGPPFDRYELDVSALERLAGPVDNARARARARLRDSAQELAEDQKRALQLIVGHDSAEAGS